MGKEIKLTEEKVLTYNEKSYADTKLVLEGISEDHFNRLHENCKNYDRKSLDSLSMSFHKKGLDLWLHVKVEDSFAASSIYRWIFGKSDVDGGANHVLGLSLHEVMYSKPSGYTEQEKEAIKRLYELAFGK